uniref:Flavodoxin-like domain-containing protein n=1 Tax=Chromera velia CCMP2878 TaxID=1169474 RepID=A0A0G4FL76_9ALVE|mmetsp:Transcript_18326/g.37109  ORF Transcript_18326/g.37109 Transcript_18326/m.37109 type:complete len:201 (-) Transcript_18326:738-1340(-)|eukprot:Cvel_17595.t1-p1 / transcript=Cvel_17595.t1 / gene=Cvel_17595 / organism=Chromera_velia_CCMP2878 / gene_product=hypothetical protein / transcript_product=hypothetical protein / location=Cvel_scaffold1415:17697-18296(-) / protein_length=200 / sequence_SO=supercontig / SO=protein_coding / is_pseudo=false
MDLTIWYGSYHGRTKLEAEQFGEALSKKYATSDLSVTVKSLTSWDQDMSLRTPDAKDELHLFFLATHAAGGPTPDAQSFALQLEKAGGDGDQTPETAGRKGGDNSSGSSTESSGSGLREIPHAVVGFGCDGWFYGDRFCLFPRQADRWLSAVSTRKVLPLQMCNETVPGFANFGPQLDEWKARVCSFLDSRLSRGARIPA